MWQSLRTVVQGCPARPRRSRTHDLPDEERRGPEGRVLLVHGSLEAAVRAAHAARRLVVVPSDSGARRVLELVAVAHRLRVPDGR